MMVRLHSNCQKDPLCHHLCLQRTSLEAEQKYWMSAESAESTITQLKVRMIAHLKSFRTVKIGFTGMRTYIIQMTAKTIQQRMLNLISSKARASRTQNAQNSEMSALSQMVLDWFGLHRSQRGWQKRCWWRSMRSKWGGLGDWSRSRAECVNVSRASIWIMNKSSSERYIMGEWRAVACEYRLIHRCIAGAMNLLTWYKKFCSVRANSGRMTLRWALPQGQVSICEEDY